MSEIRGNSPQRIEWVDSLKGIGIALVVLGHTSSATWLNDWIYAFHVPMFFWISGFLFKQRALAVGVRLRFRSILIPYLFFGLLSWAYWSLIERNVRGQRGESVWGQLFNIFLARGGSENYLPNVALWFLPCLFVTEVVFALLLSGTHALRLSGRARIAIVASVALATACIGFLASQQLPVRLPLTLDIVPTALAFYCLGYLTRQVYVSISTRSVTLIRSRIWSKAAQLGAAASFFAGCAAVVNQFDVNVDLNNLRISSFFPFYLAAALGIAGCWCLALALRSKFVAWIGSTTIVVMCVHEPIKRIVLLASSVLAGDPIEAIRENAGYAICVSIVVLFASIGVYLVVQRFLPWVIGPRRQRNRGSLRNRQGE